MKKLLFMFVALCLAFICSLTVFAENLDISQGREYSILTPPSVAYPDDGKKLTDGMYGTHKENTDGYYASGEYVGFNKSNINDNGNFVIILDLGKTYDNIAELTIGYLNETSAGIYAPKEVSFAVSENRNGNYSQIGTIDISPEKAENSAAYAKSLHPEKYAKGRFVLVTIKPSGYTDKKDTESIAPWTFIDEINVQALSAPISDQQIENQSRPEISVVPTEDEIGNTPQTGDNGVTVFAFVLLAFSAITMAVALFTRKKTR